MSTKRTATKAKTTVTVLNGGAHRGAFQNLDAFLDWNRESTRHAIVPRYVDAVPGRGLALAEIARQRGLAAEAIEGRIEEEVLELPDGTEPIILNVDRAGTIAEVLNVTRPTKRTTMGYLLVRLPNKELWALRFAIAPGDTLAREMAIKLFSAIAALTAPRGSAYVIGSKAESAHVASEPRYRAWMATHTRENIGRIVAGLTPEGWPLEVTADGHTTRPLVVVESDSFRDPALLARELLANPPLPLVRGEDFIIAETTPTDGVRFHTVRLRLSDGKVSVNGQLTLDHSLVSQVAAEEEAEQRSVALREEEERREAERTEAALRQAERATATRLNPLYTTD